MKAKLQDFEMKSYRNSPVSGKWSDLLLPTGRVASSVRQAQDAASPAEHKDEKQGKVQKSYYRCMGAWFLTLFFTYMTALQLLVLECIPVTSVYRSPALC